MTVLAGVGVMLVGVVLASMAGFGRDREVKKTPTDLRAASWRD